MSLGVLFFDLNVWMLNDHVSGGFAEMTNIRNVRQQSLAFEE
jgi:hypothetical protein